MQNESLDLRGLACPEPVVLTRQAIMRGEADQIAVLVDDPDSAENIGRMADTLGWAVVREELDKAIRLSLSKDGSLVEAAASERTESTLPVRIAVFITSDEFGTGESELGAVLMRAFIKTLKELDPLPNAVIFANSGIRLTIGSSIVLGDLKELETLGTRILSCGTCLDYYHLKDALKVGQVTNMFEIVSTLATADRVLRP